MSESDNGTPKDEIWDAGTVGAHRQRVGAPVAPDERMSLNVPPKQPGGGPSSAPTGEGGDGTPSLVEGDGGTGQPTAVRRTPGKAPGKAAEGATGKATGAPERSPEKARGKETGEAGGTSRESVRRDIERDRRELGETVEALVRKTDVRGRVHETAAQVGDELRRAGAATAATATGVAERVRRTTPADVRRAADEVTTRAARRPVAAAAVAAVTAAVGLVVFRLLRRGRRR
ncbi:DUF3618 domain-containing protein [Streptosporangium sp. NPDC020072]|uniref:DUF3618 domain-containing protein n=1 Tax=Streptosporangium sp. NPDC020072 TaxID=3154788 RepID=UPI00343FB91A